MKKVLTTEENYRQRIDLVMQYIKDNLDKDTDILTLSTLSGFSPFHLHRIIKAYTGESIGSFVVRKRVETAAKLLLYSTMTISDIAYRVGYNVPTSLNKAFAKHYGISPTQYRHSRKMEIFNKDNITQDVIIEPYSIVDLPMTNIIYIGSRGHYRIRDYHSTYQSLISELQRQSKSLDAISYLGIFYDNPDVTCDDRLYNEICISTQEDIEPNGNIEVKRIPGGKYIVFKFNDKLSKLDRAYNQIYGTILTLDKFQLRDSYGFEKYNNDLDHTNPNSKIKIDIHIPIE